VSYNVSFIESHEASNRDLWPGTVIEPDGDTDTDEPRQAGVEPPLPPAQSPPVLAGTARPARTHAPSEKRAMAEGIERVTPTERAVAESRASTARVQEKRKGCPDAHVMEELVQKHLDNLRDDAWADDCLLASGIPDEPTWKEAMASANADCWRAAFHEELQSIKKLGVFALVPRSSVAPNRRILKGRPVLKLKRNEEGVAVRYKCRYVCKGYEAVHGLDYTDSTSLTARMESFRVILHIAAALGWDCQQVDVKTAFLYGDLKPSETFYMEQPKGFEEVGKEDWVWSLLKGLYGAPHGGRVWNRTMNDAMLEWGFT
jgi:hypothetical protein